jgi:hypothetical protein
MSATIQGIGQGANPPLTNVVKVTASARANRESASVTS